MISWVLSLQFKFISSAPYLFHFVLSRSFTATLFRREFRFAVWNECRDSRRILCTPPTCYEYRVIDRPLRTPFRRQSPSSPDDARFMDSFNPNRQVNPSFHRPATAMPSGGHARTGHSVDARRQSRRRKLYGQTDGLSTCQGREAHENDFHDHISRWNAGKSPSPSRESDFNGGRGIGNRINFINACRFQIVWNSVVTFYDGLI